MMILLYWSLTNQLDFINEFQLTQLVKFIVVK